MRRFLQSTVVLCAGVLGIATASVKNEQDVAKHQKKSDLRETILRKFLQAHKCPDEAYTGMFLAEADTHGLDWRLLPSIAILESGGGQTSKGNNIFGWANGKKHFTSIGESIHHVASAMAHARPYSGKDLNGKIKAYNQFPDYRIQLLALMHQLAPSVAVAAD